MSGPSQTQSVEVSKLAPLVAPETIVDGDIYAIDLGPIDYVLRCTKGQFTGRFIYINRTGEIFGCDRENREITMYIEKAGLSPKHAEIKYVESNQRYYLRDTFSTTGTYVKCRYDRRLPLSVGQKVQIEKEVFQVQAGPMLSPSEIFLEWLTIYDLSNLEPLFANANVRTANDLLNQQSTLMATVRQWPCSEEEKVAIELALYELTTRFFASCQHGKVPHIGSCYLTSAATTIGPISLSGGCVLADPDSQPEMPNGFGSEDSLHSRKLQHLGDRIREGFHYKAPQKCVGRISLDSKSDIVIEYFRDSYCIRMAEPETNHEVMVELGPDWHCLYPEDIFQIGDLQFTVLRFNTGLGSDQGFRSTMEDEELAAQDLAISEVRDSSYFAVYDGHGGRECAAYVRAHLHQAIRRKAVTVGQPGGLDSVADVCLKFSSCLNDAFRETDEAFLARQSKAEKGSGCAAVGVVVLGGHLFCANCGDSRAVLCRGGVAVQLSSDHKPDREDEHQRIEAAGGFVSFRRVLGRLAVSRALGDYDYKHIAHDQLPLVISEPEVRVERLTMADEFMLLACDGLFDVFDSQDAVTFIRQRLAQMPRNEQDPQKVVVDLIQEAIKERRSRDNVTAILVSFRRYITRK
eukprot:Platyproteum_vivax@DN4861_c0_g1_i1.p1